ncbi:MAG: cell division protein FtsL [Alphaproteobacteria bacterium]
MISRSTILTLLVAIGLGFGLFRLTYEVQTLEGELSRVNRAVAAEREAIHVLRAEWSYLNEPTRLEALTKKHLSLRATQDGRIRTVAEIPARPAATATTAANSETTTTTVAANVAPASPWGEARPTLTAGKPLP